MKSLRFLCFYYTTEGLKSLRFQHLLGVFPQYLIGRFESSVFKASGKLSRFEFHGLRYKSLIDSNWHNLYCPKADWAKFCKIAIFLLTVRKYISELGAEAKTSNPDRYYNILKDAIETGAFEATAIATTNYNNLIEDILERKVTYLNGSTSVWYDPYLNKMGTKEELGDDEHHIIVPLIFRFSEILWGKMTSILYESTG